MSNNVSNRWRFRVRSPSARAHKSHHVTSIFLPIATGKTRSAARHARPPHREPHTRRPRHDINMGEAPQGICTAAGRRAGGPSRTGIGRVHDDDRVLRLSATGAEKRASRVSHQHQSSGGTARSPAHPAARRAWRASPSSRSARSADQCSSLHRELRLKLRPHRVPLVMTAWLTCEVAAAAARRACARRTRFARTWRGAERGCTGWSTWRAMATSSASVLQALRRRTPFRVHGEGRSRWPRQAPRNDEPRSDLLSTLCASGQRHGGRAVLSPSARVGRWPRRARH